MQPLSNSSLPHTSPASPWLLLRLSLYLLSISLLSCFRDPMPTDLSNAVAPWASTRMGSSDSPLTGDLGPQVADLTLDFATKDLGSEHNATSDVQDPDIIVPSALALTKEQNYRFHKSVAMSDFFSRISASFTIDKSLEKRVAFWFDVYAKYHKHQHILHHSLYPWIVFDVVDLSDIENNHKLHRWTRYHRGKKLVKQRLHKLQSTLDQLSRRRDWRGLTNYEVQLLNKLGAHGKSRRKALQIAAKNLRSQTGQKDFFAEGLQRYQLWLGPIEQILRQHRLPVELARLPFVESSYNPAAVSKVGASGIWQIMPGIGRKFLRINDKTDQRNDPLLATQAAAKILKENKMILRHWPLALTAYNTGPGLVNRARKEIGSHNLAKLIENYNKGAFGFAAKNFYSSFLAALYVEKYQEFFFIQREEAPQLAQQDL